MSRAPLVWATVAATMLAAGCGGGTPPAPGPRPATPVAPGTPPASPTAGGPVNRPGAAVVLPKEPEAGPPLPPMAYEPKGRRDPFSPVQLARETGGINVSSVKLVGVIQGRHGLLALVEAPDGIGYILRNGDVLGDGRVTAIAPTSITFAVVPRGAQRAQAVTLRLPVD